MTIRDLLSINSAWFNDYIRITKGGKTLLSTLQISTLHPAWLDYEIKAYVIYPHEEDDRFSAVNCNYIITITGSRIIQDKRTCIDKSLNERIKEYESTNNN